MSDNKKKIFLEGKLVYLRALERQDLEGDYRIWINDREVTRFTEAGIFPANSDDLVRYFENNTNRNDVVMFAVIDKATGKHIGNARVYGISWVHRTCERGIMIGAKEYWGKGYGLETINLVSKYVFEYLNLNKVKSGTFAENIGVHKVNERAGYKREGEARQEVFCDGEYHDVINWGLLKSDYMAQKAKEPKKKNK